MGFVKLQLVAKFQKWKGETIKKFPLETLKKFEKEIKIEYFEQCHSAENCKRGTLWDFLTTIVLQKKNKKKLKGRPFGGIQKASKKVA